jgi:hypothetical protein
MSRFAFSFLCCNSCTHAPFDSPSSRLENIKLLFILAGIGYSLLLLWCAQVASHQRSRCHQQRSPRFPVVSVYKGHLPSLAACCQNSFFAVPFRLFKFDNREPARASIPSSRPTRPSSSCNRSSPPLQQLLPRSAAFRAHPQNARQNRCVSFGTSGGAP